MSHGSLLTGLGFAVPTEEGKAYMSMCWASNHPFSRGTVVRYHIADLCRLAVVDFALAHRLQGPRSTS